MIEELLRAAGRGHVQVKRVSIPACADELLREAADRYAAARAQCPFAIGAVITPRKDSEWEGAGDPHIVVEHAVAPGPNFGCSEPGRNSFGAIPDIRVLSFSNGNIVAHWMESWCFEFWQPPAPAADEPAEQP